MTYFDYLEIVICLVLYIPQGRAILNGAKQSLATWGLWALLDVIATASVIYQHGNFTVIALYACGGIGISLCILKSKNFSWEWFDTVVSIMAVVCMVIWAISGPRNATIASTIAVAIAGAPLLYEAYKAPWDSSLFTWSGFLIVNILGTIQGKSWTVQERLYPATCTVLCLLLLAFTAQKLWVPKPLAPQPVLETN